MGKKNYERCKHNWDIGNMTPEIPQIKCSKCNLSIELYKTHVSFWDYTKEDSWLGYIYYNSIKHNPIMSK